MSELLNMITPWNTITFHIVSREDELKLLNTSPQLNELETVCYRCRYPLLLKKNPNKELYFYIHEIGFSS